MAYDERTIASRHRGVAQHRLDRAAADPARRVPRPDPARRPAARGRSRHRGRGCTPTSSREPVTGVRLHAGRGPRSSGSRPTSCVTARCRSRTSGAPRGPARLDRRGSSDRPASGTGRVGVLRPDRGDRFAELVRSLLDSGQGVGEVADAVGYSPRQLHRRLLPVFGYGPQHLGRVLRLVRAVAAADAGHPWSDVAQSDGLRRPGPPGARRARPHRGHAHRAAGASVSDPSKTPPEGPR